MPPMSASTAQQQMAPSVPAEAAPGEVVVVGRRETFRLDTGAIRAAQAAFQRHRQRFAPQSTLAFLVTRRGGGALPAAGLRLWFTDGRSRIGVPVGDGGRFDLTGLPAGRWWLASNLSRREVRVEPLVLSPQSSRYDYRLGDGRLQCRVSWAMLKASVPFFAAPLVGAADAIGPCTSRKIGVYATVPAVIRSGVVRDGARALPLEIGRAGRSYRYPGGDPTLGNEARVTITM